MNGGRGSNSQDRMLTDANSLLNPLYSFRNRLKAVKKILLATIWFQHTVTVYSIENKIWVF